MLRLHVISVTVPSYLTAKSPDISFVWDYVPTHFSLLPVTWPHRTRRIQAQTIDRVDPSPHNHPSKHVLKKESKLIRSMVYLVTRGRCWSVGSSSNGLHCDRDHHRDLPPSDGGRSSQSGSTWSRDRDHPLTCSAIGRRRGLVEELHDRGPIEPRSRRAQAVIVEISSWNRFHGIGRRPIEIWDHDQRTIVVWLRRDRGLIVVRSWSILKRFWG